MRISERLRALSVVQETVKPQVIIQRGTPLTEKEIDLALNVSDETQWWKALIQLIEQYRNEYAQSAWQSAGKNNPLALAADVGSHEALSGLLVELEKRRSGG